MDDETLGDPAGFALGTVQLGQAYGWSNRQGMLADKTAISLLHRAFDLGVRTIDTAGSYGQSESRIGAALRELADSDSVRVITKISIPGSAQGDVRRVRQTVRRNVMHSLDALGIARLQGVLLHEPSDYLLEGGAAVQELEALKADGAAIKLGASLNVPVDVKELGSDQRLNLLQIPMNILDRRWDDLFSAGPLANRHEVFVRSAFLQGILVCSPSHWPTVPNVDANALVSALHSVARKLERDGVDDLCIAFLRAKSWVDWIVLGLETVGQLERNLELFERPPLSDEGMGIVNDQLPTVPNELLMPWMWARR